MNQSKDNLNEEWRKVFDKVSETPPPDIWEAIERHLDEQNRVPLAMPWWRKTQTWLTAASVLLVLGLGAALFLINRGGNAGTEPDRLATSGGNVQTEQGKQDFSAEQAGPVQEPGAQQTIEKGAAPGGSRYAKQDKAAQDKANQDKADQVYPEQGNAALPARSGLQAAKREMQVAKTEQQATGGDRQIAKRDIQAAKPAESSPAARTEAEEALAALDFIAPPGIREIDTYWQRRYVFFNPYAGKLEEQQQPRPEPGPLWASVSVMPGGFNPNMQFSHESVYQMNHMVNTGNPLGFTGMMAPGNNREVTSNRDQPRISIQAGAQVGFKLSERWSLESGVAFLRGNSTSRSPGFFMDRTTNESADLLPNAMVSGNANYSSSTVQKLKLNSSSEVAASAVYVPMDKNMSNNYSYLQVPAYVGYTLRPEKKLSYTLLGGGITNFFLKNNLETASGYTLQTTRENNVYNDISFSAAAGVRLNYRLNGAWNTGLTANYQYSLMNSFKENRFLSSRPQVYGISWGVRYTFQK